MSGCERPAASPEVAQLVARVLDGGSPLEEPEIVALFQARGADFEVHFSAPLVAVTPRRAQSAAMSALAGVNAASRTHIYVYIILTLCESGQSARGRASYTVEPPLTWVVQVRTCPSPYLPLHDFAELRPDVTTITLGAVI